MADHPITPPPELVQQWLRERPENEFAHSHIATQAARWGADQELEACCEWMRQGWDDVRADKLRAARRPKPPSLKGQALETLQRLSKDDFPCNYQDDADWAVIRRAIEALPDE